MNHDTFTLMRSMDAAPEATIDMSRAPQLREDILRTSVGEFQPARARSLFHGARQKVAGAAALSGAAATAVVATLAISSSSPAYADWTATPQPLSAHDTRIAEKACTPKLAELDKSVPAPGEPTGRPPMKLSERRGDYVLLEYATPGLSKVDTCLVTLEKNTESAKNVDVASGGGGISTARVGKIDVGNLTTLGDPQLTVATGAVGKGVRAVTIHSGRHTAQASIRNGVFTAVWPGSYTKRSGGTLVETVRYDVTLGNGTVIKNAPSDG